MLNGRAFKLVGLALLVSGTLVAEEGRSAVVPPPNPPDATLAEGDSWSSTQFTLRVQGYTTLGASPGEYCAIAIGCPGVALESVRYVDVVESGTSNYLDYYSSPDAAVTQAFSSYAPGYQWHGFLLESHGVPAGVSVDLVFSCTVRPTWPPNDLVDLQADLSSGIIGTDEALANGSLTGNALSVVSLGTIEICGGIYTFGIGCGSNPPYLRLRGSPCQGSDLVLSIQGHAGEPWALVLGLGAGSGIGGQIGQCTINTLPVVPPIVMGTLPSSHFDLSLVQTIPGPLPLGMQVIQRGPSGYSTTNVEILDVW